MIPTLDELELQVRTGRGVAIILEGEGYGEDPWFYGQWFNDLAHRIAFFPQDGWERVRDAVDVLRRRGIGIPVFGIIDRDFVGIGELDIDFAVQGILRTPRYCIENYLLNPEGWADVFRFIFRRSGHAPDGWDQPTIAQARIERAYRDCLKLSAHNRVVQFGSSKYTRASTNAPRNQPKYLDHPDALPEGVDVVEKLRDWGRDIRASEDLGSLYIEWLQNLETQGQSEWEAHVSGKYVLKRLHSRFPRLPGKGQFALDHYLNLYLDRYPDTPGDLQVLIDRILFTVDQ